MRYEYGNTFPRHLKADILREQAQLEGKGGNEKVYKMKYKLNFLLSMAQDDGPLIEAIANSEELAIYKTQIIRDVIDYKWATFAKNMQIFGAMIHIIYVSCLIQYITNVFLRIPTYDENGERENPDPDTTLLMIISACLLYPTFYDGT